MSGHAEPTQAFDFCNLAVMERQSAIANDAEALVRIEVRRSAGPMPLTIPRGVDAIHLLTMATFSCGGSIRGRLRSRGPSYPGDRNVVDEPGDERHDDRPAESVILQDRGHDAAPATGCRYPPWATTVGWWLPTGTFYGPGPGPPVVASGPECETSRSAEQRRAIQPDTYCTPCANLSRRWNCPRHA